MRRHQQTGIAIFTLFAALAMPLGLAAQEEAAQAKKAQHHHYKLIDLGTFGGPQAYLPNLFLYDGFQIRVLDNSGVVIGEADSPQPDPFPNFCFTDCFVSHTFRAEEGGELTDLGALPGGGSSAPFWMSRSGLIAGISQNGQTDPLVPGFPELRAVLWQNGGITDLGTLQGGYESWANAVNNKGEVAGMFTNTTPEPNSMFGLGYQTRAFFWQDGVMQDLGTLGGTDAWAFLINDRGQVVGWSYLSSVQNQGCWGAFPTINIATGSFVWDKENGMRNLGSLGGMCTTAMAINSRGQIAGISTFEGETAAHAFLWDGSIHDLGGSFGGSSSQAFGINEAGEVVGFATLPGDNTWHAALWSGIGNITDLGVIGGNFPCSSAHSINAKGQVVGEAQDCPAFTFHSFLWEHGSIFDLNDLIPPSPLVLASAQTINDRGEIAGTAFDASFNGHAFLLIPCDDDHPGVEGCDYSMVDAEAGATAGTPTPATNVASPSTQGNPALRGAMIPMLRRFGRPFGPWYRGMGAESPAVKPTSAPPGGMTTQRTTEGAPGQPPSCSGGSDRQSGAEAAESAVTAGNFITHGYCEVVDGDIVSQWCAVKFGLDCSQSYKPLECPGGAKVKQPGYLSCGPHQIHWPVDLARPCK
jgi:probable HAF family extracellular repeat protein